MGRFLVFFFLLFLMQNFGLYKTRALFFCASIDTDHLIVLTHSSLVIVAILLLRLRLQIVFSFLARFAIFLVVFMAAFGKFGRSTARLSAAFTKRQEAAFFFPLFFVVYKLRATQYFRVNPHANGYAPLQSLDHSAARPTPQLPPIARARAFVAASSSSRVYTHVSPSHNAYKQKNLIDHR